MTTALKSLSKLLLVLSAAFLMVSQAQAQSIALDMANGATAGQAAQAAEARGESLEEIAEQLYVEGETVESVTTALTATGAGDEAIIAAMIATQETARVYSSAPTGAAFESAVTIGLTNGGRNAPPPNMIANMSNTVTARRLFVPTPSAPFVPTVPTVNGPPPPPGGGPVAQFETPPTQDAQGGSPI